MPRLVNQLLETQPFAAAGSSQATATLLRGSQPTVLHVTGADGTKGVILPKISFSGRGRLIFIKNDDSANAILKVYPAVGQYINALTVNTAFSQPAQLMVAYVAYADNAGNLFWYTLSQTTTSTTPASVTSSGPILSSSATGGVGYGAGAGGTVTQATNKSTGVTLNKVTGAITMNNASLADAATVSFTVTDSAVAATDNIVANHASAGTAGAYQISANAIGSGTFNISVRNVSGGALVEAIVIHFSVIKAVSA